MVATPTHIASDSTVTTPLVLTASTEGDLLLIFTRDSANQYSTGVTDSAGGTWTMLSASPTSGTVGRRIELWVKIDSPPITSVSIAFASSSTAHAVLIKLEGVTNNIPTGPYATTFQSSTTTPTELTLSLPRDNMLVISAFQSNSNTQANHFSEGGWTRGTTSATGPAWAWRNDLSAGTNGCTWTVASAQGSGTAIIAFRSKPTSTVPQTLFGSQVPSLQDWSDGPDTPYTLGTWFNPQTPLRMTHFRWYVPETAQPGGASIVFGLWDNATETLLFDQEFDTAGLEDQWIQVPVEGGPVWLPDTAASGYMVTVYTPNRFVSTSSYTWSGAGTAGVVTCPQPGGFYNGVWAPTYPDLEIGSTNYFVDLVYDFGDPVLGLDVSVWNGTTEIPASITIWNGSSEVSALVDAIS